MTTALVPVRPLLTVAHRAGNDLAALRRAEAAGVDLIEADVWLFRGRLEVRHRKTMGPAPLLWDRWELVSGFGPRLLLDDLLAAARPETPLMLDLKGTTSRLSTAILRAIERASPGRTYTVCSRNWNLLDAFLDAPGVRVLHSVGSAAQLRAVGPRLARLPGDHGISIHQRLLTPAVIAALHRRAGLIITWPVNTLDRARELHTWGVDGVISDELLVLRALLREREGTPSSG